MGVFLLNVAVLLISAVMLRSHVFGRVTASVGALAGGIGLTYYIDFAVPEKAIFLLEISGGLFVIWIVLLAAGSSCWRIEAEVGSKLQQARPPHQE